MYRADRAVLAKFCVVCGVLGGNQCRASILHKQHKQGGRALVSATSSRVHLTSPSLTATAGARARADDDDDDSVALQYNLFHPAPWRDTIPSSHGELRFTSWVLALRVGGACATRY